LPFVAIPSHDAKTQAGQNAQPEATGGAHLSRDFAAHTEGLTAEKEFGEHGLEFCERVFWAWEVSSTPMTGTS
jgi:hypothetical protein